MIFNSGIFALFFVSVFIVHFSLSRQSARRSWLLIASYIFYGWWDWRLLGLILGVSCVAYLCGLYCARPGRSAKRALSLSIALVLSVLGIFKYYGFFIEGLMPLLSALGLDNDSLLVEIVLPVGISFYTFQAISYMVDVYRGRLPVECSLINVCLYIAFFPQLIAGPIVRATQILPQMKRKRSLTGHTLHLGARVFLLGLIYKVGVADNLAGFVEPVYSDIENYDRLSLILATLAFHSQIYFDFAGYSTMAVGLALVLGYRIPRNFKYPYATTNPTQFWRHWHISLSTWFRDYVFIPLGGKRQGTWRWVRNLLLTMGVAGLWHGAAWPFILWGVLHGFMLVGHKAVAFLVHRDSLLIKIVGFLVTQLLVLALWTTFRVESGGDLAHLWAVVIGLKAGGLDQLNAYAGLVILPVIMDHLAGRLKGRFFKWQPSVFTFWLLVGLLIGALAFIYPGTHPQFIYFQF